MSAEKEPLFAKIDSNRDFIKKAIRFLQAQDEKGNPDARAIVREYFLQSEMISHDEMADKIEAQLIFRDQLTGPKLEAVKDLREVYRFMRGDVYDIITGQRHPKSQELCDNLTKSQNALDVLSAGWVDSDSLRYIQACVDAEYPGIDECDDDVPPRYSVDGNIISLKTPEK